MEETLISPGFEPKPITREPGSVTTEPRHTINGISMHPVHRQNAGTEHSQITHKS